MKVAAAVLALHSVLGVQGSADGFVGYFNGSCPDGWSDFSPLQGRLALLVNNSFQAGEQFGLPLTDCEDRGHEHLLTGSMEFDSKHVASTGGLNEHAAKSGQQPLLPWLNATAAAPSGYPFVQLTACRYSALSLQPPPVLPPLSLAMWDPQTVTTGCPAGSDPFQTGSGRVLGAANSSGPASVNAAPALMPGSDVQHAHTYNVSITLPTTDFVGIDGCCDNDPTSDGTKTAEMVSGLAGNGLPHFSILSCSIGNTSASAPQVPTGFVLFTEAGCPAGWVPLDSSLSGRLIVATPQYGVPQRTFGGPPIPYNVSAWSGPDHVHDFELSIETVPAGIGLDTGCCAHGYGSAGTYQATGQLAPSVAVEQTLPLVLVQACVAA